MGRRTGEASARWRELIQGWRRSSLSVAEFCRQQDLAQASFFQWRNRLETEAPNAEPLRFVQLPTPAWAAPSFAEIRLPGGAVVAFSDRAPTELVTAAIRAAMQASVEEPRSC